jgi:hypothetical protein
VAKHCYIWAGVPGVVYTATPAVTPGIAPAPDLSQKNLSLLREKVSDPKLAFEKP